MLRVSQPVVGPDNSSGPAPGPWTKNKKTDKIEAFGGKSNKTHDFARAFTKSVLREEWLDSIRSKSHGEI